jgi:uncharacterized OB-fold protein
MSNKETGMSSTATEPLAGAEHFGAGDPGDPTHLVVSTCRDCGRAEFPSRTECPACGGVSDVEQLTGPARLRVSTAVLAQPPGSKVEAPYGVGVAEFGNGLCVIGLLHGEAPSGSQVDVVVHEPYPGGRMFAFREAIA